MKSKELDDKTVLKIIADNLIKISDSTSNLGLFSGKMGIAIFLFHYARYTSDLNYENYAEKLIDDILTSVDPDTLSDFSDGLAGVAWGIEHLVDNNFVEADVDEILEDVDKLVFQKCKDFPALIHNNTDFYGYVFYTLTRLKDKDLESEGLLSLIKKQMLIYIHDDIERLLTKKVLFDFTVPTLTMQQINPIMYFLIEMGNLKLYPTKLNKLINYLPQYLSELSCLTYDIIDEHVFFKLKEKLIKKSKSPEIKELYGILLTNSNSIIQNEDMNIFAKLGWNSLLYQINYSDNLNYKSVKDETLSKFTNKSYNGILSEIENNCLMGIGLTLLLEERFYN